MLKNCYSSSSVDRVQPFRRLQEAQAEGTLQGFRPAPYQVAFIELFTYIGPGVINWQVMYWEKIVHIVDWGSETTSIMSVSILHFVTQNLHRHPPSNLPMCKKSSTLAHDSMTITILQHPPVRCCGPPLKVLHQGGEGLLCRQATARPQVASCWG